MIIIRLASIIVLVSLTAPAFAQTACPVGVAPGSPQCGPDSGTSRDNIPMPPPRPTGEWIKTWGAIAGSDSTGEAGTAAGELSEDKAKDIAIRRCSVNGASDCKINLVYRNQCAALVSTQSDSFYQGSATKERAIDLAIGNCKKSRSGECKVLYSGCSDPIFKKY
ncbi:MULTISPECIES: DUF4189 domain-containing protein [Xanthomonas]|uniref:DUF4189 domain-containing protein n=1 Tax=Xanthomonas vasicola TaxID=56459 RepID=A0ABD7SCW4_XANVA|nr:DUF4189 domain-containing protein [Xanthomonas vasicola]AZR22572.1 DUF4189 domain-containing protein [Xanthomonas vasicola]MDO6985926.1 DUF4189 domain-containing protein [Xanthomonas vasicola]PPV01645.1 DUF4189 domain-containing protein [Xanthomonas vasicola]TWQ27816.1 DUF4189 domain-containing protein [Xanthomonas vasicola]TWQ37622.1 DUF4189 domain-containing protein [Xanthomonas vasicola]